MRAIAYHTGASPVLSNVLTCRMGMRPAVFGQRFTVFLSCDHRLRMELILLVVSGVVSLCLQDEVLRNPAVIHVSVRSHVTLTVAHHRKVDGISASGELDDVTLTLSVPSPKLQTQFIFFSFQFLLTNILCLPTRHFHCLEDQKHRI